MHRVLPYPLGKEVSTSSSCPQKQKACVSGAMEYSTMVQHIRLEHTRPPFNPHLHDFKLEIMGNLSLSV